MLQHIRLKIQENTKADHMRCILYVVRLFYISGMHAAFLYHSVPRFPFFMVLLFLIIQKIKSTRAVEYTVPWIIRWKHGCWNVVWKWYIHKGYRTGNEAYCYRGSMRYAPHKSNSYRYRSKIPQFLRHMHWFKTCNTKNHPFYQLMHRCILFTVFSDHLKHVEPQAYIVCFIYGVNSFYYQNVRIA